MTTLISLLSDQTLPNVLFIEAVKTNIDAYIFINTQRMEREQKMDVIIKTCQLKPSQCSALIVDPEQYDATIETLRKESWSSDSRFLIHITGGTKMMALAVKDFFQNHPHAEVYYIPIGQSKGYALTPNLQHIDLPQITLQQYLAAYGYSYIHSNRPELSHPTAHQLFEKVLKKGHPAKVDAIINSVKKDYQGEHKKWYSGEWFEEWLYEKCKTLLNLPEENIAMKVKIKNHKSETPSESDNEFDVLFVKNNKLFIIEAKVYSRMKLPAGLIINPMYKIASQQTFLGLHAHSIVAILFPLWRNPQRAQRINDLKRVLRIHQVWDLNDLKNFTPLIQSLG